PVWPFLIAALDSEDLPTAHAAALAIAERYRPTRPRGIRDALLAALRCARTADHAAAILLSLLLGWPDDAEVANVLAAARAQSVLSVRLIALCARLGVLRLPSGTTISPTAGPSGIPRLTEDERAWLIRQLDTENFHDRLLSAYLADAIVAAMHDGTDTTEEV